MSSHRCVVIGAGIMGASVAAALADSGTHVTLLDRDQPGRGTGPVAPPGPVRVLHTPELSLRPHPGGLVHLEAPDAACSWRVVKDRLPGIARV